MATWCGSGPGEAVTFKNLDYVVRDRIAEITLRRAPVNAIDHGLIEDLNDAYRQARADTGVRAVILTSAFTRAFSAGMDLAMIRGKRGLTCDAICRSSTSRCTTCSTVWASRPSPRSPGRHAPPA